MIISNDIKVTSEILIKGAILLALIDFVAVYIYSDPKVS